MISKLAIALLLSGVFTQGQISVPILGGSTAASVADCTGSSPSGCLFRETFDGSTLCFTALSSNCLQTWSFAAGVVFNYNTAPAPLQGSFSLSLPNGAANQAYFTITGQSDLYAATIFNDSAYPASDVQILSLRDGSGNTLCSVNVFSTNQFLVEQQGGSNQQSTSAPTWVPGTTYYARLHATVGSGTNAQCTGWWSSDGITWNATPASTNGTWTTNVVRVEGFSTLATGVNLILDDIRLATTQIHY